MSFGYRDWEWIDPEEDEPRPDAWDGWDEWRFEERKPCKPWDAEKRAAILERVRARLAAKGIELPS